MDRETFIIIVLVAHFKKNKFCCRHFLIMKQHREYDIVIETVFWACSKTLKPGRRLGTAKQIFPPRRGWLVLPRPKTFFYERSWGQLPPVWEFNLWLLSLFASKRLKFVGQSMACTFSSIFFSKRRFLCLCCCCSHFKTNSYHFSRFKTWKWLTFKIPRTTSQPFGNVVSCSVRCCTQLCTLNPPTNTPTYTQSSYSSCLGCGSCSINIRRQTTHGS